MLRTQDVIVREWKNEDTALAFYTLRSFNYREAMTITLNPCSDTGMAERLLKFLVMHQEGGKFDIEAVDWSHIVREFRRTV
jgi:hypothetical protein